MKRQNPATHSPSGAGTSLALMEIKTPQFGIQLPGQINAKMRQFELQKCSRRCRHQRVNETPKSGNSFTSEKAPGTKLAPMSGTNWRRHQIGANVWHQIGAGTKLAPMSGTNWRRHQIGANVWHQIGAGTKLASISGTN